jgi:hypothetical protein
MNLTTIKKEFDNMTPFAIGDESKIKSFLEQKIKEVLSEVVLEKQINTKEVSLSGKEVTVTLDGKSYTAVIK